MSDGAGKKQGGGSRGRGRGGGGGGRGGRGGSGRGGNPWGGGQGRDNEHSGKGVDKGPRDKGGGGSEVGVRGSKIENLDYKETRRPRLESEMSEGGGENCNVCLYKISIFAIGECNHPVCHTCATRMRVLMQKNECAICRRDIPKVIMISENKKYEEVKDNIFQMDQKHKVCFETDEIKNEYFRLLAHACPICEDSPTYKTFRQVDNHLRTEHHFSYCDLCVSDLKMFTHERKYYDKAGLLEHRRVGDKDDKSLKGHPLCEFCEHRFVDKETLYKHLRKDHYFCHFCDADGAQFFFSEYSDLRSHFRKDHFLCQEQECEEEKFVVFRTEIDIKAHRLERHGNMLSKAASKQNRRIDIDYSYSRREVGRDEQRGYSRREGGGEQRNRREERQPEQSSEYFDQVDGFSRPNIGAVPDLVADFPSLGGTKPTPGPGKLAGPPPKQGFAQSGELAKKLAQSAGHNTGASQSWAGRGGSAPSLIEDFPTLPGAAQVVSSRNSVPSYKPVSNPKPVSNGTKSKQDEFPGLPTRTAPMNINSSAKSRPGASRPVSAPAPRSVARPSAQPRLKPAAKHFDPFESDEDDYPSLGGGGRPLNSFSEKTIRASGQTMDYSRTDPTTSGNINVIDQSLIQALQGAKVSEKPVFFKPQNLNSSEDFPGLEPSETPFSVIPKKGKKNKSKKPQPNTPSSQPKPAQPSTLSSIANLLEPEVGKKKNKKDNSEKMKPPEPKPDIKAIPSKLETVDFLVRPSKQQAKVEQPIKQSLPSKSNSPAEDFPSLESASKKMSANFIKAEDKLIKPAPVQSQWTNTSVREALSMSNNVGSAVVKPVPKPPPGFQLTGKKSGTPPPGFKKRFQFYPPQGFQDRNAKLISTVSDFLGGKSLEFKKFRDVSGIFRTGGVSSSHYFTECSKLISEDVFTAFFPELLVLLPDIDKQQELLALYEKKYNEADRLTQCSTCRQVVLPSDLSHHSQSHNLDSDFPVLG